MPYNKFFVGSHGHEAVGFVEQFDFHDVLFKQGRRFFKAGSMRAAMPLSFLQSFASPPRSMSVTWYFCAPAASGQQRHFTGAEVSPANCVKSTKCLIPKVTEGLEAETRRNGEVMWFPSKLSPDHKPSRSSAEDRYRLPPPEQRFTIVDRRPYLIPRILR
jgi:hypothetical protein